ncbi:MAG: hypothetical protein PVI23_00895 [Maricaulaceae bacterium]|jgi:hypothetical protein
MSKKHEPFEAPFSAAQRLPKSMRLLIFGRPGHSRQCLAALAKIQGVADITVVESTEDAFCAVENAYFDAMMFDVEDLDGPIEYLLGPLKRGVLGPDRPCPAIIAVAADTAAVTRSANTAGLKPDVVLKKPASFDGMRAALIRAAALAPIPGQYAAA